MALIQCAECNREISDKARACPGCGAPTVASTPASSRSTEPPTTVEQTSKRYKGQMLLAVTLFIVGLITMIGAGGADPNHRVAVIGVGEIGRASCRERGTMAALEGSV